MRCDNTKKEKDEAIIDRDYWLEFIPPGWIMIGFSYGKTHPGTALISPVTGERNAKGQLVTSGDTVNLDSRYMNDYRKFLLQQKQEQK